MRRLLWLRKQLFWKLENAQPSPCLGALMEHFEREHEPPVTAGYFGASPLPADLEAAGLLPGWHRQVMEASIGQILNLQLVRGDCLLTRLPSPL